MTAFADRCARKFGAHLPGKISPCRWACAALFEKIF
jgi:hypothetical protein